PVVTIAGFPVVTSVTPPFGLTLGGDRVTLLGERLSGVSRVTFGGVAGSNITVISDGELRVTTPLHAAGVVDVVAESVDGVGLAAGAFRFVGDASDVPLADVNKDGKVDAVDVQLVTSDVLRRSTKSLWVTDVNNDGAVNTLDVQQVINTALVR
ncbi:MAG TPA: dockerin type I domain-containing protein, partial [Candidatus Hydrogenedentes bacterium]|nr:dockerin type I domain-containing protein [Candidatus Hydrogenedentota bacterium]